MTSSSEICELETWHTADIAKQLKIAYENKRNCVINVVKFFKKPVKYLNQCGQNIFTDFSFYKNGQKYTIHMCAYF